MNSLTDRAQMIFRRTCVNHCAKSRKVLFDLPQSLNNTVLTIRHVGSEELNLFQKYPWVLTGKIEPCKNFYRAIFSACLKAAFL